MSNMYKGKYPKKCLINTVRSVFKIQKYTEEEIAAIKAEEEEHKKSE